MCVSIFNFSLIGRKDQASDSAFDSSQSNSQFMFSQVDFTESQDFMSTGPSQTTVDAKIVSSRISLLIKSFQKVQMSWFLILSSWFSVYMCVCRFFSLHSLISVTREEVLPKIYVQRTSISQGKPGFGGSEVKAFFQGSAGCQQSCSKRER